MNVFKSNNFPVYLPLLLSEIYLFSTLGLLFFGPLIWPISNSLKFTLFVLFYQIAFALGYIAFVKIFSCQLKRPENSFCAEKFFTQRFWVVASGAFVATLISHRNLVHSDSYIPWTFFSDLQKGLEDPAGVRNFYASDEFTAKFRGNTPVSALLVLVGVFKYSLLPGLVFLWNKLSVIKKTIGMIVALLPVASGICISLSATSFVFVFVVAISFGVLILREKKMSVLRNRLSILAILFGLSVFSVLNFYQIKTGTSFMSVATGKAVPHRFDYLRDKGVIFKSDSSRGTVTATTDLYEKITVYLVNGYFGMSLALEEEFDSTFGLGHSLFLQRIFDTHLGSNLSIRTFQHKISHKWDKNILWHSAYSYFANDVGFFGVALVMFILGFFLSMCVWASVMDGNLIASSLIPLFGIMVLYLPANNQIFSFLETMCSFWILSFFLLFFQFQGKDLLVDKKRVMSVFFTNLLIRIRNLV